MAPSSGPRRTRASEFTAPLTIPGGAVAGADIVRELAPEYSLTAWQVLRSALMWAGEEPALRGDLFERCAMVDWERELLEGTWEHELRCPLAVIVGELRDATQAAPDTMARACLCVTEWALPRGHVGTGLAFAEAAALCWSDHPRYAWTVGRLMRTHGRLREAEQWIRRAVRVATSNGDQEARILALNSLGNVLHAQGRNPESLRTLRDALRNARKHRLRAREGEILHDLFVVSSWAGELEEAELHAREAFEIYRGGHRRLPALAHDVASFWIMRGYFGRALSVLKVLPPYLELPEERIKVLGALARAAAACEDTETFDRASREVWTLANDPGVRPRAASALMETAVGASSMRDWDMVERAITTAVEIAEAAGELDVLVRAEAVREALREGRNTEEARRTTDVRAAPQSDSLVAGFLASLAQTRSAAGV